MQITKFQNKFFKKSKQLKFRYNYIIILNIVPNNYNDVC